MGNGLHGHFNRALIAIERQFGRLVWQIDRMVGRPMKKISIWKSNKGDAIIEGRVEVKMQLNHLYYEMRTLY